MKYGRGLNPNSRNGWKKGTIPWNSSADHIKSEEELLIVKRFSNQRYKARRKNSIGSHSIKEWLLLKEHFQNMCLCCKKREPEILLTEDHIVPLSRGGTDYIDNIQPLCFNCNSKKWAKTVSYLPVEIKIKK